MILAHLVCVYQKSNRVFFEPRQPSNPALCSAGIRSRGVDANQLRIVFLLRQFIDVP